MAIRDLPLGQRFEHPVHRQTCEPSQVRIGVTVLTTAILQMLNLASSIIGMRADL